MYESWKGITTGGMLLVTVRIALTLNTRDIKTKLDEYKGTI